VHSALLKGIEEKYSVFGRHIKNEALGIDPIWDFYLCDTPQSILRSEQPSGVAIVRTTAL
jgi:hypothetical protein